MFPLWFFTMAAMSESSFSLKKDVIEFMFRCC